jgi:MFS family permease
MFQRVANALLAIGRFQRNAQLYLLSNALSGVSLGILLVLYNLYLLSLGYKTDFIGLVLFTGSLGAGLAIFPAGLCIDRFGGKVTLIWTNLLIGAIGAGQILFRQPVPLLITAFAAGVVGAFFLVINAPYLTANSTAGERANLFSINIVLTLITTVLGEILGGALPGWFRGVSWLHWLTNALPRSLAWLLARQAEPRSYQLALLFAGLLAIPSLVPIFLLSNDRPTRNAPGAMSAPVAPFSKRRLRQLLLDLRTSTASWQRTSRELLKSAFLIMLAVQVLIGLGAGLFIPYFNIFFVQHLHASPALFGLIDGGANAINAVLTLLAPWLASRVGRINTITFTRLLSIPLLLTVGLTPLLPVVALLYLFRQGMMDMSLGIFQVYSMEVIPPQRRGIANSSYQVAMQASVLTTPLGGVIIAHRGYSPVFFVGAAFYSIAILLLWGRFRKEL